MFSLLNYTFKGAMSPHIVPLHPTSPSLRLIDLFVYQLLVLETIWMDW